MIPKLREWPMLIWLGVTSPAWQDRPPRRTQLRHQAFARADRAGWWLMEHDHYAAAMLLWRTMGVW